MKTFETPVIEVIKFSMEDVITASTNGDDVPDVSEPNQTPWG